MQQHEWQDADLAKRLVTIEIADACSAQSQCLRHHTRAPLDSAASLPGTPPQTLPSKLSALKRKAQGYTTNFGMPVKGCKQG